jgi:hypothetical protein
MMAVAHLLCQKHSPTFCSAQLPFIDDSWNKKWLYRHNVTQPQVISCNKVRSLL